MADLGSKTWLHYTLTGDDSGAASVELAASAGHNILAAGGWAEPINYANSNSSSTSLDYTKGTVPVVVVARDYDSGTNTQTHVMGFALATHETARAHLWIITD